MHAAEAEWMYAMKNNGDFLLARLPGESPCYHNKTERPSVKPTEEPNSLPPLFLSSHLTLYFHSSFIPLLLLMSTAPSTLSLNCISPYLHPKLCLHSDYSGKKDLVLLVFNSPVWLPSVTSTTELNTCRHTKKPNNGRPLVKVYLFLITVYHQHVSGFDVNFCFDFLTILGKKRF